MGTRTSVGRHWRTGTRGREGIVTPSHHCLSSLAELASPAISLTVDHEDADDGP
jgi:hypothetical protein